ncbi:FAD:protein FMN transferase [Butyrivibrio sp. VCB2006]|uniref:FAD:protein FMN transferase n=1 Tax=Butyrivibrio sp. VCB2006 TaxID=1280679 RepID=UPI001FA77E58|nr:FAD:protein FMN transferase [Butyrivibrio sp. VCB2006]
MNFFRFNQRVKLFVVATSSLVLLCSCAQSPAAKTMHTTTLFAMDTVMELQIAGDEALLTDAEGMIRNLEKELSVTDENSEIAVINKNDSAPVSEETFGLISEALSMCKRTDGALDITIYPVLKAWGFTTSEYRVPADAELEKLLQNVNYKNVSLDESSHTCSIPNETMIDLGSVAKGYTSRKLTDYFTEKGVTSGLINLGGNVQCIGTKPNGQPWKVAIKSPFPDSSSGIYGVLDASDEAVITSGGYERYFEENGEIYWHILDPKTGKPAKKDLLSVTIVGKDGLVCDALSTSLFVKGLDGAIEEYKKSSDFDTILITTDGDVYITEGISNRFSLASEYYNAQIHVVSR